jgi:hypothetical protein
MIKERDMLRNYRSDLANWVLDAQAYGSASDADHLANAKAELAKISTKLGQLSFEIHQIYQGEFDTVFTPSHKKQTRVNQDKKLPNADKPRKHKNEAKLCACGNPIALKSTSDKCGGCRIPKKERILCATCNKRPPAWKDKSKKEYYKNCSTCHLDSIVDKTVEAKQTSSEKTDDKKVVSSNNSGLEAVVTKTDNPQSITKQQPSDKVRGYIPMFVLKDGKYVYNGVITIGKCRNNKRVAIVCTHQLRDNTCFVQKRVAKKGSTGNTIYENQYVQITFNKHYAPDISATYFDNFPVTGKLYELSLPPAQISDVKMYSLDPNSLEQNQVWLAQASIGSVQGHNYIIHKSDTHPGQCGSPYMSDDKIIAIHNQTDYTHNKGSLIPSQLLSDFQ